MQFIKTRIIPVFKRIVGLFHAVKSQAQKLFVYVLKQYVTFCLCSLGSVSCLLETDLAVRFTLSQPITAALTPGDVRLFRKGVEVGSKFKPLKEEEIAALKKRAEGLEPIFKLASA